MKKLIFKSTLLLAVLFLAFTSCRRETKVSSNHTQNLIQDYMTTGVWEISNYIDSGIDETHHFNGYIFSFRNNGTVTATGPSFTFEGYWSINDCHKSHNSIDDLHFNLNFNLNNQFQELNDDWDIVSYSPYQLALFDISGSGSGTDYLTFARL